MDVTQVLADIKAEADAEWRAGVAGRTGDRNAAQCECILNSEGRIADMCQYHAERFDVYVSLLKLSDQTPADQALLANEFVPDKTIKIRRRR